jgi:hypothetical protein
VYAQVVLVEVEVRLVLEVEEELLELWVGEHSFLYSLASELLCILEEAVGLDVLQELDKSYSN